MAPSATAAARPDAPAAAEAVDHATERLVHARRSPLAVFAHPWMARGALLLSDSLAFVIATVLAVGVYLRLDPHLPVALYERAWPLLLLFIPVYAGLRLYSLCAIPPAEELRRIAHGTALVYLLIAVATFLAKEGALYSRGVFLIAGAVTVVLLPLQRALVRALCCRRRWWGMPVIVLGAGLTGRMVVKTLRAQPQQGLRPVAVYDDDSGKEGEVEGVPVFAGLDRAPELARRLRIHHAILAMPGAPVARLRELEQAYQAAFPHLILIPNICGFASLWVNAHDLGGILGFEVRRNLLLRGPRILKRSLDILLALLLVLPVGALTLAIALAIRCESRGPVFFGHERIGKGGRRFRAWKFRSMVIDADQVLARHLDAHPALRAEWERDHKLREDPRVTRVGWLLRRTSLDELPQLWNVLVGDMSLIGPRPIVAAEVDRYRDAISLYHCVRPGISGLWQVSGRTDVSYEQRVALDSYYVRNWSVWLDIYILARTVRTVLLGKGAY